MEDASRHEGFVKLSRKLTKWEWYDDPNTLRVFLHCLLLANWKDSRYHGVEVPRGSFMTGRAKLAKELHISERAVRTALEHLISTNELTIKTSPKGSIITVVKYNEYQATDQQNDQQPTNNRPTTDQRPTSNKNIKNNKNYKEGYNARERSREKEKQKTQLQQIEDLYLRGGAANV